MIPILFSLVKYMSSRQGEKGRRKVVGKRWGRGHSLVLRGTVRLRGVRWSAGHFMPGTGFFQMNNRFRVLNWFSKRQMRITGEAPVISNTSEIRRGNL